MFKMKLLTAKLLAPFLPLAFFRAIFTGLLKTHLKETSKIFGVFFIIILLRLSQYVALKNIFFFIFCQFLLFLQETTYAKTWSWSFAFCCSKRNTKETVYKVPTNLFKCVFGHAFDSRFSTGKI